MKDFSFEESDIDTILRELTRNQFHRTFEEHLEKIIQAEIPVPDHLRDTVKEFRILSQLKLGQKIGILSYLIEFDFENQVLYERLLFLQEIASFEAISSGIEFRKRLISEKKLRQDLRHAFIFFISSNFRLRERKKFRKQRIRGYRDKGTLPDHHLQARRKAQEEAFMSILSMDVSVQTFLKENLPDYVFEGDFLDLPEAISFLKEEEEILERLRGILLSKT